MIEPGLVTRLKAQVASVGGRVYPVLLPQDPTFPAITYQMISDPRLHSADGADRLVSSRYQITPWATTYGAMKATQDEVRQALDGFQGTMGDHEVALIEHAGGRDFFERDADEVGLHSGPTDYLVHYEEA